MAEWSKALVLGTSYFGSAGSNPAPVMVYHCPRGISSIGRVRRSQRRGTGIETRILHLFTTQGLAYQVNSAIGLVVKYLVANEVPRVRFPDGAFKLSWRSWQRVGLIIPRSPVRSRSKAYVLPDSLGGQDTRLSPERPGFNSRSGNFFSSTCSRWLCLCLPNVLQPISRLV